MVVTELISTWNTTGKVTKVHSLCLLHYYEMTGFVRVPVNVSRIFPDEPHKPPASKAAIDSLKTAPIEEEGN